MYKVIGKENDMFKVLDLDKGTEELLSAEDLVLALGQAEIEGCQHSENGIEVWYAGVEKYEIPIEVWAPVKLVNVMQDNGIWRYEVSNLGRVRSYGRSSFPRFLSQQLNPTGYISVCLTTDRHHTGLVHKLVGDVFVYNPDKKYSINHKDECKSNNRAYNLEWMTLAENNAYGTRAERISTSRAKCVRQYAITGELVAEFESLASISDKLGFNIAHISSCCNKANNRHVVHGFVWRYATSDDLYGLSVKERKNIIFSLKRPVVRTVEKRYNCGIRQYSLAGELLNEFSSLDEASCCTGVGKSGISRCCLRAATTAGGYLWRYVENDELFSDYIDVDDVLYKRRIRKYTLDGSFVAEYFKLKDAMAELGVSGNKVANVCKRLVGNKTYRGFLWRYSDDDEFADRPENAKAIKEWRETHNV